MDIPNLLYCLILTRNTPPSLFLPSYLHLIPFIPSSLFYPSLFFPIYLSLTLCFSSFFPLSLSSSLPFYHLYSLYYPFQESDVYFMSTAFGHPHGADLPYPSPVPLCPPQPDLSIWTLLEAQGKVAVTTCRCSSS